MMKLMNEYVNITDNSAKKTIMERVDGYMKRAEDLKNVLEGLNSQAKGGNLNVCSVETTKKKN